MLRQLCSTQAQCNRRAAVACNAVAFLPHVHHWNVLWGSGASKASCGLQQWIETSFLHLHAAYARLLPALHPHQAASVSRASYLRFTHTKQLVFHVYLLKGWAALGPSGQQMPGCACERCVCAPSMARLVGVVTQSSP